MGYRYRLPKDKSQAEDVIFSIIERGRGRRNPEQIRWWIASNYLKGVREYSNIDYSNGTVSIAYMDEAGLMKFRYDGIVAKYMSQLGRLEAINLSPKASVKGFSLDGFRKSSIATVVLNSAFPQEKINELASNLNPAFLMYGTVGLALWIEDEDSMGIDVVPPWELMPIPVDVAGPNEVRGLIRTRWVPEDWVKGLTITPDKRSKVYKKVDTVELPSGDVPDDLFADGAVSMTGTGGGFFIQSTSSNDMGGNPRSKKKEEENVKMTRLVEVWTETTDGLLAEYSVYAGVTKLKELYRHDHSASKYYMPIRVVRDVPTGGFWGRSFVDQHIPLNNEVEYALSSVFQSISDFDLYGLMLWPTTMGTPTEAERGQDGIKRIRYEPDYTSPDLKPENIQPAKLMLPHIQAMNLAISLMDRQSNQPSELMAGKAPGRVDSGAGMGFLWETAGIPLSPSAKSIAAGVAGIYRAALRIIKDLWSDEKVVSITNLDDDLAGIILDTESGTMSLSKNAVPFPDEVTISVASEVPISKEQMKAELKEALDKGRITLEEFTFKVRKEGLDLPVGMDVEWQNHRRAVLNNIILFGDGRTPGQIIYSERDLHRIHIQAREAFMARPEFYSASAEVREAFVKDLEQHKIDMGAYPEQLPMPEDVAGEELGMPPEQMM